MSKTTPEEAKALAEKLRQVCNQVRGKSYPLADLIPLLQQTANFIDEARGVDAEPVALTDRAALASSCKFIEEKIVPRKCDSDGVASCWRCNSVYLAKRMRELLNTHPAPSQPAAPVELPVVGEIERGHYGGRARNIGFLRVALYDKAPVMAGDKLVKLSDAQAAIAAGRKAS